MPALRLARPPARRHTALALGLALAAALAACSGEGDGGAARLGTPRQSRTRTDGPRYVGSTTCANCHAEEHAAWTGSHHDLAMQDPNEATVLGDFDDAVFEHLGVTTRFFRRDDAFWVETEGPDGGPAEYRVRYVFGIEPLQQYLFELDGGKVQCLTVAWDTERHEWFSLYPDDRFEPGDPLHWTGRYQNWNGMCAECHSTGLEKGYDPERDAFRTTFAEIDVSCEACHGPGSEHLAWAKEVGRVPPGGSAESMRLANALARGDRDAQIDTCAPCHSRRSRAAFEAPPGSSFHEKYRPELLVESSYFADGQVQDEVYVYGSFAQSAMHERGVACTDCHDPHSLELLTPGNSLCTQCHTTFAPLERFPTLQAKDYDTPEHHHHPEGSEGARCVSCHMPSRTYMVVDPRRDHSFRIPRPDLARDLGTPDACSDCHEEGPAWAAERVEEWYGEKRPWHFARTFARARRGDPDVWPKLAEIARDVEKPEIVRVTALEYLRRYGAVGAETGRALLDDESPWVRATAIRTFEGLEPIARIAEVVKLVEDPSRTVRAEAARSLAPARKDIVEALAGDGFESALAEWEQAQRVSAEMPWAHLNLGAMYQDRSETERAVAEYLRAIELDPYFLPASFNLTTLYNSTGRNLAAERVLRAAIARVPEEGQLHYSLGLLLNEMGRVPDAAASLLRATELLPPDPRVYYNAGLALDRSGRDEEAERLLLEAARLGPEMPDVAHALALFYEEQGEVELALPYAEKLRELAPEAEVAVELLERLRAAQAAR